MKSEYFRLYYADKVENESSHLFYPREAVIPNEQSDLRLLEEFLKEGDKHGSINTGNL